jgi:hypothetical protein
LSLRYRPGERLQTETNKNMRKSFKLPVGLMAVAVSMMAAYSALAAVDVTVGAADSNVGNTPDQSSKVDFQFATPDSSSAYKPETVVAPVPEPMQYGLFGGVAMLGLAAFTACRRSRQSARLS